MLGDTNLGMTNPLKSPAPRSGLRPTPPSSSRERWRRFLQVLLILAPFLVLASLVAVYGVDVPVQDQWSLVSDIDKLAHGNWGLADLIRSHNGHRILVPRLILVPLALATGWNVRVEMFLNLFVGLAIFAVLAGAFRTTLGALQWRHTGWLAAAISIAVFSLSQWENWLWGIQLQVFLALLATVGGIWVLASCRVSWKRMTAALALGFLAAFSSASGLAFWIVGLVMVATAEGSTRRRLGQTLVWCCTTLALVAIYVHHYPGDAGMTNPSGFFLHHPLRYLAYVLSVLGAPLASFTGSEWPPRASLPDLLAGSLGLPLVGVALVALRRRLPATRKVVRLGAGCAAFSLGFAALAGLGRAQLGVQQAVASRYITLATPFWITALVAFGLMAWPPPAAPPLRPTLQKTLRAASAFIVIGLLVSSVAFIPTFPQRYNLLMPARAELVRGELEPLLARLQPDVHQVYDRLGTLKRLQLSVFRKNVESVRPVAEPVPLSTFRQIISVAKHPSTVAAGSTFSLNLSVANPGPGTWPTIEIPGGHPVHLSYHWLHADGSMAIFNGARTALPHDIRPGERIDVVASVVAPGRPGRYLLRLTMVQETVAWFDGAGATPTDIVFQVTGPGTR